MRRTAVAAVATAVLSATASVAVAQPYYDQPDYGRDYRYDAPYRGYYRDYADIDAVRAKCQAEYEVARLKYDMRWNRHEYVSRCIDRNLSPRSDYDRY